ncbi:evolutionarily conserved signaling intermediate in Toll pathway, mitochondrial [Gastrophryne carolinensis]
MAPSYANLFMANFESKYVYPSDAYQSNILTMAGPHQIHFLDVQISNRQGILITDVYKKLTDRNTFLHAKSYHPPSLIKALNFSQFVRIRRITATDDLYDTRSGELVDKLIERGYDLSELKKAQEKARNMDRISLRKIKPKQINKRSKRHWPILGTDDKLADFSKEPPMTAYKRARNLRSTLVQADFKSPTPQARSNWLNDLQAPAECRISPCPCGKSYVGKTKREIRNRIIEHRSDIRNGKLESSVAKHFLEMGHPISQLWFLVIEVVLPVRMVQTPSSNPPSLPKFPDKPPSALTTYEDLFSKQQRDKASFMEALDMFCHRDIRRRGHVEMIEAALKWMPEFGVERDLEVYNKILDIFPKEVFVHQNFIQTMFLHYPRQQECAVQLLEQMETYGVTPNKHTQFLITQTFGRHSHPMKKYQRIMYWFPRFKHANPYPVPVGADVDPVTLSKYCLQRISGDRDAQIAVYQLPATEECDDGTVKEHSHLVGIQSPDQMSLLEEHDTNYPVLVEGPFPLWLRKTCVEYYVLRAEPNAAKKQKELDPERSLYYPIHLDLDLDRDLGDDHTFDVDGVEEGPVYAMCMAGDEKLLAKWIQELQASNPVLGKVPVLFRLTSGQQQENLPVKQDGGSLSEEEEDGNQRYTIGGLRAKHKMQQ